MKSLPSACRHCYRIKYDFTCGKELTSASEECSVPLTAAGEDTVPDIKTCGRHSTDRQKESVLAAHKHSAMILLITNPTHQMQEINLIHYKMILTYKVQTAQTVNLFQVNL
jgi:hypothetical protein